MIASVQEQFAGKTVDQLFEEYRRTHDNDIKWEIALRYSDKVKAIALQIRGVYCTFTQLEDVINEGIIVLADAVDKFDPTKGQFDTYINKRIRGMIIDMARQHDWVPRSVRQRAQQIDKAMSEIYYETGKFPSDEEITQRLGITIEEYHEAMMNSSVHGFLSLEEIFDGSDQLPIASVVDSEPFSSVQEQKLQNEEMVKILARSISELNENEQLILSLYYQKNLKMKDIADVLEISSPRVSQIHARALQKLKVLVTKYMNE